MKNKWILVFAGIAALSIAGYVAVMGWLKKLKYGVDSSGIKIQHIGFDYVQLKLPIWIYNPTPFDVIVKGFNIDISINSDYVATMNASTNYMLASKTTSSYPVLVNVPTMELLEVLKLHGAVIDEPNWQSKVNIGIAGTASLESGLVSVNNMSINFDESLKYWMG